MTQRPENTSVFLGIIVLFSEVVGYLHVDLRIELLASEVPELTGAFVNHISRLQWLRDDADPSFVFIQNVSFKKV